MPRPELVGIEAAIGQSERGLNPLQLLFAPDPHVLSRQGLARCGMRGGHEQRTTYEVKR
jgi:hypothetical protein